MTARQRNELPVAAEGTIIRQLPEDGFAFQAEVLGRVPGSFALYEKQVDVAGTTLQYTKTTFNPAGAIFHVKDKITGLTFGGP
jgi:hypothetical protein